MKIKNPIAVVFLSIALFFGLASSVFAEQDTKKLVEMSKEKPVEIHDKRISLGFTAAEKAEFLTEMRQMLTSIQGIMMGIGTNDRGLIIKSARYSGNRMARATPKSIKKKTPVAFEQIGGSTHMMFEELVVRAEEDDMDILAELTGELMKNCLACHATFKVD